MHTNTALQVDTPLAAKLSRRPLVWHIRENLRGKHYLDTYLSKSPHTRLREQSLDVHLDLVGGALRNAKAVAGKQCRAISVDCHVSILGWRTDMVRIMHSILASFRVLTINSELERSLS